MTRAIDLVTFGEAMIRLSPPGFQRLEQSTLLDVHIGGSELNAAVAASHMGLRTSYVTRLTANPLGRLAASRTRLHGVDTSHVIWTAEDRIGTYYVEFGASPRANSVIYDRANSAIARIKPGMVNWGSVFSDVKLFYTSGITPALSSSAADTTLEAIDAAKSEGVRVCIDLNYRAKLWTENRAREVMTAVARKTDILFATEEDTFRVFGIQESCYEDVARRLADTFEIEVVAITLRENPSVWKNRWTAIVYEAATDKVYHAPTYDIEVVDRVGSGDSFVGGFLCGYLKQGCEHGVRIGVALSAIKQTIPGDLCWATPEEVDRVLNIDKSGLRIAR